MMLLRILLQQIVEWYVYLVKRVKGKVRITFKIDISLSFRISNANEEYMDKIY